MMRKSSATEAPLVSMAGTLFHLKELCHEVETKPLVPKSLEDVIPEVSGALKDVVSGFKRSIARVHETAPRFLAMWAEEARIYLYSEIEVSLQLHRSEWARIHGRIREMRVSSQVYPWRAVELVLAPFELRVETNITGETIVASMADLLNQQKEHPTRVTKSLTTLAKDEVLDEGRTAAVSIIIPIQEDVRSKLSRFYNGGTLTYKA